MSQLMSDDFILDAEQYDEFKMWQGLIGPYYYPSVDSAGNLSWTNNGGLSNPAVVNIQGRGLTIVGIVEDVSDLPETADNYVTYLVGEDYPYNGYIYDNGTWVNLGIIGASAGFGTPTATIDSGTGTPAVTITASGPDTAKVFAFAFSNLKGANGQDGVGVPSGGSSNEVLKKKSNTDYDTEWGTVEALPTGGTTGQVLRKKTNTNYDVEWADASGGDVQTVNNVQPDANGNVQITASNISTNSNGITVQNAIDDAVHVGTSAPTDPTCKIWLDTDEPGMSAVSSVNGKTGTVVIDDIPMTLLWTNASPTSTFAAQTVPLDLSDFDFVLVDVAGNSTNSAVTTRQFAICSVGETIQPQIILNVTGTTTTAAFVASRVITVQSTGIVFGEGYNKSTNATTAPTAENNRIVPLYVWGIKGAIS